MKKAITIVDVARLAGVSRTTASDALNNNGRVSEPTRLMVERAASALGYRPNAAAQSLRTATKGAIGIHLPEVMTRIDYYLQIVYGALEEAARQQTNVTLITSQRLFGGHRPPVDGVILLDPLAHDTAATQLMDLDVPVVTLEPADGADQAGIVSADHEAGVHELLDHFVAQGASTPALLASPRSTNWGTRVQTAYRQWCRENGKRPLVAERTFGSDSATLAEAARELLSLDEGIDAVLCGPDGSALVVMDVLQDSGKQPGDDVQIAALVDNPALAYVDPPVTAIDLAPRPAGARCVELLLGILRGERAPDEVVPLEIEVQYRASTRD